MDKITHHQWLECSYNSLPQWVKHKLNEHRAVSGLPEEANSVRELLRGKSFFYLYQRSPMGSPFYHRKLRYHSISRCRYLENWNPIIGAGCNADYSTGNNIDYEKLTEDIMRSQKWLDAEAFELRPESWDKYCGDWCIGYKPR